MRSGVAVYLQYFKCLLCVLYSCCFFFFVDADGENRHLRKSDF